MVDKNNNRKFFSSSNSNSNVHLINRPSLLHNTRPSSSSTFSSPSSLTNKPPVELVMNTSSPPKPKVIFASTRQSGNPVLSCVKSCRIEYHPILPDFIFSRNCCAVFISLRFHLLHPDHIEKRMRELFYFGHQLDLSSADTFVPSFPSSSSSSSSSSSVVSNISSPSGGGSNVCPFSWRALLCLIDVDSDDMDTSTALQKLNVIGVREGITLILAWSKEQMASHLESLCNLQSRNIDAIAGKGGEGHVAKFTECITSVPTISKNDAQMLAHAFGTVSAVLESPADFFSLVPNMGTKKVNHLYKAIHSRIIPDAEKD